MTIIKICLQKSYQITHCQLKNSDTKIKNNKYYVKNKNEGNNEKRQESCKQIVLYLRN